MDKYKKLKQQISLDNGTTWSDVIPYVYEKGELIEHDSPDCSDITWQLVFGQYICEEVGDPTEPIYEWRVIEGEYVCDGYNKCKKEAEYVSTDLGQNWQATGRTRPGSTVEVDSEYCGFLPVPQCYITDGGSMSVGYTSISEGQTIAYKYDFTNTGCFYRETQERHSSTDTGDINYPLQYNMFFPDCENGVAFGFALSYFADGEGSFPVDYKFIFADCEGIVQTIIQDANIGTSSCGDAALEKSNFAATARTLWNCITKLETSGRYTFAGIIQKDEYSKALLRFDFDTVNKTVSNVSLTVSCIHKRYRRVPIADSYICEGTDKYQAVSVYESDDDGESWEYIGIEAGLLIEEHSEDCGVPYRWVADTGYVCVGYDKYNKEKEQMFIEDEWVDTGNTRAGSTLIEADSEDCGYVPPTPVGKKATITYLNGDTYDVPLNGSSNIAKDELTRGIDDWQDPHFYTNITNVVIDSSVTLISNQAFSNFSLLSSVSIPDTIVSIGDSAFYYCSGLTSVSIPGSVQYFGRYVFQLCSSLSTVVIGNGITYIGEYAFEGCTSLTSVTIPSSVSHIYACAFQYCTSLTSVTIPSSVSHISEKAFKGCSHMNSIVVERTTPPALGSNVFNNTNNCPIYVPAASVNAYKAASVWSDYADRIQAIQ